ncbi:MAG: ATP-binding protein [Lentisphaerota bacterium]
MEPSIKGHEILVIDDEFDSVKPLLRILERNSSKTHYAPDALTALEMVQQHDIDLIIIDVLLGKDNGFDLFQRFRELKKTCDVPILFLSGLDHVDATVAGLSLGAGDFITKPYNLREISARISLQLRLRDNERLLRNRNQELSRAYEELRVAQAAAIHAEKLAAIGRLSAGIAHEMSTPLSFIISNLKTLKTYLLNVNRVIQASQELISRAADKDQADEMARVARSILQIQTDVDFYNMLKDLQDLIRESVEGAEVIAKIANDLREFSREEYEDLVPSDINQLIDKALTLTRNERGSRIRVEKDYGQIPPLACIPGRVTQLLLIVLVNAAQAIEGEGVIRVRSRAENGKLTLSLADTGRGIDEKVLPHIFEPFYTTKPTQLGTGLGLSIAQKIVDFHGGTLSLSSEVGKGTEVTCVFPLSRSEAGKKAES